MVQNNKNTFATKSIPRLAVGLPVYNGDQFIAKTIESILAQTFEDFTLHISDNASTDATEGICRAFAAKDRRVRYFRQPKNMGINANAAKVLELAGEATFFALIGHDDLWAPAFAEKIIAELDRDARAPLGFSRYDFIDEIDRVIQQNENVDSIDAITAMKSMTRRKRMTLQPSANFIHGIARRALMEDSMFRERHGIYEDVYYLRYLAGYGHFVVVPEHLFKKRMHPDNVSGTKEHSKVHSRLNLTMATGLLAKSLNLSPLETVSLWLNLNTYFRIRRPALGKMAGAKRHLMRLLGSGAGSVESGA